VAAAPFLASAKGARGGRGKGHARPNELPPDREQPLSSLMLASKVIQSVEFLILRGGQRSFRKLRLDRGCEQARHRAPYPSRPF
jgi:hypothetical protein